MKFYYCLMQNAPFANQFSCFRMLRCEEVDSDDQSKLDTLSQEFQKLYYEMPNISTMFFHLPTVDVKTLVASGPQTLTESTIRDVFQFLHDHYWDSLEERRAYLLAHLNSCEKMLIEKATGQQAEKGQ